MAGIDYISCNECGKRLIYDGDFKIRNKLESELNCQHCIDKLKKKIKELKKHDRRKH